MKTIAIIQARMGATRLPGKVLRPLCGQSVLGHVVARVQAARRPDGLLVATTEAAGDDVIAAECVRLGIGCFRGSEQDVLARYQGAARASGAEAIVRITADCPLFDGLLLDQMLAVFLEANQAGITVDYLSNVLKRTFPRGLDAEICTSAALERAHREATQLFEREHVTPFLYRHPELFRLRSFEGATDLSAHRWTLDTPEDWEFIEAVYEALPRGEEMFSTADVLKLLKEKPELTKINAHVEQKKLGQ
ncbi:MAG: glycosyltransferase family protein [Chloroflexi bacterium]|nr:glycosyltransferase family protein [Chloroflexota bacterium]